MLAQKLISWCPRLLLDKRERAPLTPLYKVITATCGRNMDLQDGLLATTKILLEGVAKVNVVVYGRVLLHLLPGGQEGTKVELGRR